MRPVLLFAVRVLAVRVLAVLTLAVLTLAVLTLAVLALAPAASEAAASRHRHLARYGRPYHIPRFSQAEAEAYVHTVYPYRTGLYVPWPDAYASPYPYGAPYPY